MRNILVTGGAGFIGSNFVRLLHIKDPGYRIIIIDALTYAGSMENLYKLKFKENYKFFHGDINNQELINEIFIDEKIDTVVHFAAESHVDRSILDPEIFINTNILGTYRLLEAARNTWAFKKKSNDNNYRFHHVSTDEVYGTLTPGAAPFSEITPYYPRSPYSASKASSDHLVRSYYHTYGLPITISNCSNNYGPYQFPEKFIPLIILSAMNGKSIPVYGDGGQVRDWLYVDDHCEAIYLILQNGAIGETYNIGGGNQPTNMEIVGVICDILDEKLPDSMNKPHRELIKFVKDRPGHDRRYAMDYRKISGELGWAPRNSLEDGLRKTVEWYINNQEWIKKISREKNFNDWIDINYNHRGME